MSWNSTPGTSEPVQVVRYWGREVIFPNMPDKAQFFERLTAGRWEGDLFRALEEHVDPDTVYIDAGGWIGVTPFWAAKRAHGVIVIEPDPVCGPILQRMLDLNDARNVRLIRGAVTDDETLTLRSVKGFGSSETSALKGNPAESVIVAGVDLADLIEAAGPRKVVIKIDIEGYEFKILGQLARLDPARVKAVLLATHAPILAASISGNRFARRLRVALSAFRLAYAMRRFTTDSRPYRICVRALGGRRLRNLDMLFVSGSRGDMNSRGGSSSGE